MSMERKIWIIEKTYNKAYLMIHFQVFSKVNFDHPNSQNISFKIRFSGNNQSILAR